MDKTDRRIAGMLQRDARCSNAELAAATGLSISAVNERARRMVAAGVVKANRAILDPEAFGCSLCAFVFVDLGAGGDETEFCSRIAALPAVQECHHVTGEHSYLLKVRVGGTAELQRLLADDIKSIPRVARTVSFISLDQVKETTEIDCRVAGDD
jgi:Lrp/AsnC family leucine-responsive transcriptional regulator